MEKYNLSQNVKVFGMQVKTFPEGVGEAFGALGQMITDGHNRSYYGISHFGEKGEIIYKAAAEENYEGEADKYNCEQYIIEKGEYLTTPLKDWRKKTDLIKGIFYEMMKDNRIEKNSYCTEWYKSDDEMLCMIKIDEGKELQSDFEKVMNELTQLFSSFSEKQVNTIPHEGSWTAGQVAQHLVLSNSGFAQLLNGPVKETERAPDEFVATLKESFLNFDIKMESPDFVRPVIKDYDKEALLQSFEDIRKSIIEGLQTSDLSKTCTAYDLPVLGLVTRLEAINFVIVHTKRHIHQLKKISKALAEKKVEKTF